MTACPHCLTMRSAAARLKRELASHKGIAERAKRELARLRAVNARLQAERTGLTAAAEIARVRHGMGVHLKPERIALMRRLRAIYSAQEIATLMGYSRQRIHQLLNDDVHLKTVRPDTLSKNLTLEASRKLKSLNP